MVSLVPYPKSLTLSLIEDGSREPRRAEDEDQAARELNDRMAKHREQLKRQLLAQQAHPEGHPEAQPEGERDGGEEGGKEGGEEGGEDASAAKPEASEEGPPDCD